MTGPVTRYVTLWEAQVAEGRFPAEARDDAGMLARAQEMETVEAALNPDVRRLMDLVTAPLEARIATLEAERDELHLTLLAEQGDPTGAPSGEWTWSGASGAWRRGRATVGRISWLRDPAGDRCCWWWDVPGVADGHAPTAREAMKAANGAAEWGPDLRALAASHDCPIGNRAPDHPEHDPTRGPCPRSPLCDRECEREMAAYAAEAATERGEP